jgi:hypothetical protein
MHKSKGKFSDILHKGFKPDKWFVEIDFCCSRTDADGWGNLPNVCFIFFLPTMVSQQDVAADGGGPDQAAAESQGGAGTPDAS